MVSGVFSIPLESNRSNFGNRSSKSGMGWVLREFIADGNQALVEVACQSLGREAPRYNPILIYGSAGTGKSLLVHGLAGRWKKTHPRARILFLVGSDFVRHHAAAIETDSVGEFRARFQQSALVVLDGIHQLAGHAAAQDELIRLIDQALERDHQVLATARQLPGEIPELAPALASRMSGGLSVPLTAPGAEARQVIIERLAASRDLRLPRPVVELLAQGNQSTPHFLHTVPQLDQALTRLSETAASTQTRIDEELVRQFLRDESPAQQTTMRSIASHAARHFQIKSSELRGATRRQHVVRARGIAMFLARRLTDKSLQQVGKFFGNRDHSTVLHSCRKTEALIQSDPSMRETVDRLTEQICRS